MAYVLNEQRKIFSRIHLNAYLSLYHQSEPFEEMIYYGSISSKGKLSNKYPTSNKHVKLQVDYIHVGFS